MEENIIIKHQILKTCRQILWKKNYTEVVSPVLRKTTSELFRRHKVILEGELGIPNAYLRETHEGAMRSILQYNPMIFEIGPCFRTDKPDESHYPEFTMLEIASDSGDLDTYIELTKSIVKKVFNSIDFHPVFNKISIADFIKNDLGVDISIIDGTELKKNILNKYNEFHSLNNEYDWIVINKYISEKIEIIEGFNFLYEYPLCTLTGAKRVTNTNLIYRSEFFINGLEVGHTYVYEDDLISFKKRLLKLDLFTTEDEKMFEKLKSGDIPSKSGILGIGIERLCCSLTNQPIQNFIFASEFNFLK